MNKGRVGEERGGKETDRCPLTSTVDSVLMSNLIGIKWASLVSGSAATQILSNPFDFGNATMKSLVTVSHGCDGGGMG
jgi:hypothetical protein